MSDQEERELEDEEQEEEGSPEEPVSPDGEQEPESEQEDTERGARPDRVRSYWGWQKGDIQLLDRQEFEAGEDARRREAEKASPAPEEDEEEEPSAVERALTGLTDAIKGLVTRQQEPPVVNVEVKPQIDVHVPETKVEVEFPEHEQIMEVEYDQEDKITSIRKRFVRSVSQAGGLMKSVNQIVREGLGLEPKEDE